MEFKKLSAVEMIETVSDASNVLIEEDGVIKRAPKEEVGGGAPKKELVYEWNFSADDVITEIAENVNDDVTWMIDKNVNIGFEAEVTFYGNELQKFTDENGESYLPVINANIEAMLTISDSQYYMTRLKSDRDYLLYGYNESDSWMPSHQSQDRPYFDLYILNKKHIDADLNYIEVDNGGSFEMYASEYWPFKSVKIYKITR